MVLACRDSDKTRRALELINAAAAVPAINLAVDLASLPSVRDLAAAFLDRYDRLDTLIHCAGIYRTRRHTTIDGIESTLAVNVLAPFLLTNLLLNPMAAAGHARIVIVSGESHRRGEIDFDDLQCHGSGIEVAPHAGGLAAGLAEQFAVGGERLVEVADLDVEAEQNGVFGHGWGRVLVGCGNQ